MEDYPRTINTPDNVLRSQAGRPTLPSPSGQPAPTPSIEYKFIGKRGVALLPEYAVKGRISIVDVSYGGNCEGYSPASRLDNAAFKSVVKACDDFEFCEFRVTRDLFFYGKDMGHDPFPACYMSFLVTYTCDPDATLHAANICGVDKIVTVDCKTNPPQANTHEVCVRVPLPSSTPSPSATPSVIPAVPFRFPNGSALDPHYPPEQRGGPYWLHHLNVDVPDKFFNASRRTTNTTSANRTAEAATDLGEAAEVFDIDHPTPPYWQRLNASEPVGLHNSSIGCNGTSAETPFHLPPESLDALQQRLTQLAAAVDRFASLQQFHSAATTIATSSPHGPSATAEVTESPQLIEADTAARPATALHREEAYGRTELAVCTQRCGLRPTLEGLQLLLSRKQSLQRKLSAHLANVTGTLVATFAADVARRVAVLAEETQQLQGHIAELVASCGCEPRGSGPPSAVRMPTLEELVRVGYSRRDLCDGLCRMVHAPGCETC